MPRHATRRPLPRAAWAPWAVVAKLAALGVALGLLVPATDRADLVIGGRS